MRTRHYAERALASCGRVSFLLLKRLNSLNRSIAVGCFMTFLCVAALVSIYWSLPDRDGWTSAMTSVPAGIEVVDQRGRHIDAVDIEGYGPRTTFEELPSYFLPLLCEVEGCSRLGFRFAGIGRGIRQVAEQVLHRRRGDARRRYRSRGTSSVEMQAASILMTGSDSTFAHTLWGKAVEIVAGLKLRLLLRQADIVEVYLNGAAWGGSSIGLHSAARDLFDKSPSKLTPQETVLLLAMLPSPIKRRWAAHRADLAAAYRRRVYQLYQAGLITDQASFFPMPSFRERSVPPFYGSVRPLILAEAHWLLRGSHWWLGQGFVVHTTLDSALAAGVATALTTEMNALGERYTGLVGASFALLNNDGQVLAYVVYDRRERRGPIIPGDLDLGSVGVSPDSRFKPLLYPLYVVLQQQRGRSPAQIVNGTLPTQFNHGDLDVTDPEAPVPISLRDALVRSRNAAAYHALQQVGPEAFAQFLGSLGLGQPKPALSLALGSTKVTEIGLANAFGTVFLRRGLARPARMIDRISYDGATVAAYRRVVGVRVADPKACSIVHQLAREAVFDPLGTAHGLLASAPALKRRDTAAKTGTSTRARHGYRGVTGTVDNTAFSLTIQGRDLPAASYVAVPAVGRVLEAMVRSREFKG